MQLGEDWFCDGWKYYWRNTLSIKNRFYSKQQISTKYVSTAKTTYTAFHMNNRESSRKLAVTVDGTIRYTQNPSYVGDTLDHQLTFRQHLEGLCTKVRARNCLLRLLAGSAWGAHTSVLRTSESAVVYNATEYPAPAWCRSIHTKKLDVALNDRLRIITGCLKPTLRELLPILSCIPPAHLRREHSIFKLALQAQLNTNHPLHTLVHSAQFFGTQRLHSWCPLHRYEAPCSASRLAWSFPGVCG